MNTSKWKKAVVHLQCATDSRNLPEVIDDMNRVREELKEDLDTALENNEISQAEYDQQYQEESNEISAGHSRDIRSTGTAVFLLHKTRYYLLTARHILWDKVFAEHYLKARNGGEDRTLKEALLLDDFGYKQGALVIYNIIFSVLTLDNVKHTHDINRFLMNFNAGGGIDNPKYTYSEPDLDLAVISLAGEPRFAEDLLERGYVPITTDDIEAEPEIEGQDLFTVGYPKSISTIKESEEPSAWSASLISVPVFSFGKISMENHQLPYFWADLSAYPGNSGGPVIANDKLIGIISEQAVDELEIQDGSSSQYLQGIPFAKVTKAKYVLELIQEQEEKDIMHEREVLESKVRRQRILE